MTEFNTKGTWQEGYDLGRETAKHLIEENQRLREALKEILRLHDAERKGIREGYNGKQPAKVWCTAFNLAREALKGECDVD